MIFSNPEDQRKIKNAMQEISDSKTRQSAERNLVKTIVDDLHDAYKDHLTKKQINKMARVFHKRSFQTEVAEADEFQVLYENVIGIKAE